MAKASAPVLFAAGLALVLAVALATWGVVVVLDVGGGGPDPVAVDGSGGPGSTAAGDGGGDGTGSLAEDLAPGQVGVVGLATSLLAERALVDLVPVPLSVEPTGDGGPAGATLLDVAVDGEPAEIAWDGGRPLALHGDGVGLALYQRVGLEALPASMAITFAAGDVHGFSPGAYVLRTPVAVGRSGIARPVDEVAFEATVESTITFAGPARATLLPRALSAEGPGRLVLRGALEIRRADGTTATARAIELPDGPFRLRLTPRGDGTGYDVEAILEGDVVAT